MKDMEREKFEGSLKNAFENAEVTPSDKVWANIELDLERAKGGDLKRRLFFYQMLAAASVVFAMAIGGIGYYYSFHANRPEDVTIAQNQLTPNESAANQNALNDPEPALKNSGQSDDRSISGEQIAAASEPARDVGKPNDPDQSTNINDSETNRGSSLRESEIPGRTRRNSNLRPNGELTDNGQTLITQSPQKSFDGLPVAIKDREVEPLYTPRRVDLNFGENTREVDPVLAMMARLAEREQEVQDKDSRDREESNSDENLWTSIGFAAGSFNTVQGAPAAPSPSTSLALASFAAPIVEQEAKANGYSYSMGINVGTRLSERWVFQGGINYLTQASEYISNNIVMDAPGYMTQQKFRAASSNDLMMADASELRQKLLYSAPYSVNNSMRFISIPLQAGYQLINKTVGLQLNAGVATDLFLQNTVSAESDQIAKTSQPVGEDSPYRAVNLSGLLGTEVSYRFGEHYRVSLNPGIRYPFNTIYKSELGVQSTPLTFDVGLRFRYIFK